MDTERYIKDALSTESRIETVVVDPELLGSTLGILIAAGNILDQIKKHVFYDRNYNADQLIIEFSNIVSSLDALKPSIVDIKDDNTKMMSYHLDSTKQSPIDVRDDTTNTTPYHKEVETDFNPRIFHSIVGMATESVELLEALVQSEFDVVNFIEELGDLTWYQAIGIDAVDSSFDEVMKTNINKLSKSDKARYKDGFSVEEANNRNLAAERDVLENSRDLDAELDVLEKGPNP